MNEFKKYDYFRFLFRRANKDLLQYDISYSDLELINNLFTKLSTSENLLKDLYILSHVKEMKNISKYFIFILKKIEDNVINFENFTQNLSSDSIFIERELLNYFSNPELKKQTIERNYEEETEKDDNFEKFETFQKNNEEIEKEPDYLNSGEKIYKSPEKTENQESDTDVEEDDEEIKEFRKNYLELIQTGEMDEENVFELPKMDSEILENTETEFISETKETESAFDLPSGESLFDNLDNDESYEKENNKIEDIGISESSEEKIPSESIPEENITDENIVLKENKKSKTESEKEDEQILFKFDDIESSFIIKKKFTAENFLTGGDDQNSENEQKVESDQNIEENTSKDKSDIIPDINQTESIAEDIIIKGKDEIEPKGQEISDDKKDSIKLSADIQEELNLFEKDPEKYEEEFEEQLEKENPAEVNKETSEETSEEIPGTALEKLPAESEEESFEFEETETEPANSVFMEYEDEVNFKNNELDKELDIMIYLVNANITDEEQRSANIQSIIDKSSYLENISREMSLEIISNIYQTITISFEKISDGKYDLSEGTLNLFKKGLSLVNSLIKGDDYFGYKSILKSIENIRNSLIEEKEKRKLYEKQKKEKEEIEKQINQRFPDSEQKAKVKILKQLIKDTEQNLNSLEKITGEYQMYEALRSLSANLNNLKEIVKLAKDLDMKKMGLLSEASYIFIKFLQNYRINPVSAETKEIFSYIIYNMKSIILNKPVEDIDVFISYLNDPVKIFSKKEKKKS